VECVVHGLKVDRFVIGFHVAENSENFLDSQVH
jgi:hypothetical protein